jgi:hypothetical protein
MATRVQPNVTLVKVTFGSGMCCFQDLIKALCLLYRQRQRVIIGRFRKIAPCFCTGANIDSQFVVLEQPLIVDRCTQGKQTFFCRSQR